MQVGIFVLRIKCFSKAKKPWGVSREISLHLSEHSLLVWKMPFNGLFSNHKRHQLLRNKRVQTLLCACESALMFVVEVFKKLQLVFWKKIQFEWGGGFKDISWACSGCFSIKPPPKPSKIFRFVRWKERPVSPAVGMFFSNLADQKSSSDSVSEPFLQCRQWNKATVIVPLCIAFCHVCYANGTLCTSSSSSHYPQHRVVFHHASPLAPALAVDNSAVRS